MKSAIVTGATGFVGIHLVECLLKNGVAVTAFCRENSKNISRLPSCVNVVTDVGRLDHADVFYHLAWEGSAGPERGDANLQAGNVELTLNMLMLAHKKNCVKFVSLGTVYEQLAQQIIEANKYRSSDFYILSKKYAFDMSNKLAMKIEIPFIWCRIGHPIGRYIKNTAMMAYAVSNLITGKTPMFGPAKEPYDIAAVEDIAHGLYLTGKHDLKEREYYIGSGAPRRLYEYLEDTQRILCVDTPVGIGEGPDDGLRYDFDWFDTSPFMKETGYMPKIPFADSVKAVARWIGEKQ